MGILALTMVLTFYDKIVAKKVFKIELEEKLKIAITLFIFGAQCLGTVLGFLWKIFVVGYNAPYIVWCHILFCRRNFIKTDFKQGKSETK